MSFKLNISLSIFSLIFDYESIYALIFQKMLSHGIFGSHLKKKKSKSLIFYFDYMVIRLSSKLFWIFLFPFLP